jgi:hypothetical protein
MTVCQPIGNVFAMLSIAIVIAIFWDELRIERWQRSLEKRCQDHPEEWLS